MTADRMQARRNEMIFDAAVETAAQLRKKADSAVTYLYSVADDIDQAGGYAGKFLDVYLAVVGMDDVVAELDELGRERA